MESLGYIHDMRRLRRLFHRYPELSFSEFTTQRTVCEELEALQIGCRKVTTGVVADIPGKNPNRRIAFRADMDALSLTEENDVPYRSENPGVMHACGHDGHMANLITFAQYLTAHTPDCNVRLIFQPAEEGEGGALTMIEGGALEGVDEIYALHVDPGLPAGEVGVVAGAAMAGTVEFDVEIAGKSVHAAQYGKGADALKGACRFLDRIYELQPDAKERNTLLHIGRFVSGSARNIVSNLSVLNGTLRFFEDEVKDAALEEFRKTLKTIDAELKTKSRFTIRSEYIPVVNDGRCVDRIRTCAGKIPGCALAEELPRYTAEDFAFYERRVPGAIFWLGVNGGENVKLHAADFDFNEEALLTGLQIFINLVKEGN